jgi:hypothetical protein
MASPKLSCTSTTSKSGRAAWRAPRRAWPCQRSPIGLGGRLAKFPVGTVLPAGHGCASGMQMSAGR